MTKILQMDYEKCTGCKNCELACSLKHSGELNPLRSRIHNFVFLEEGFNIAITCLQCDEPFCAEVCPANAIVRNETTGAVVVLEERCVGCKMCLLACPFGNVAYYSLEAKVAKCDLCEGEPECVAFCTTGALEYTEAEDITISKKRAFSEKLKEAYKGTGF